MRTCRSCIVVLLLLAVLPPPVRAGARPSKTVEESKSSGSPRAPRIPSLPEGGCFGPVTPLFQGDQPRVCPDQPLVVFVRGQEGDHDIWVRDLRDGREYQATQGPEDDLYPDFQPDCQAVVFSRKAVRGKGYDIWRVAPAVSHIEQLTELPGDELVPRLSPILYSIQGLHPETCGGPSSSDVTRYHKVVFAHRQKGRTDIRFVSDDGMVSGLVREKCEEASWTSDGLGMLFNCGGQLQLARADQLDPGSALARLDPARISQASQAIEKQNDNDYRSEEDNTTDREKLLNDPLRIKLFLSFGEPIWTSGGNVGQSTLSLNQMVALGTRSSKQGGTGLAGASTLDARGEWQDFALADSAAWPAWSPDGKKLYFSCNHEGKRHVCVTETTCPLQDLSDLVDYPALHQPGLSAHMAENGFAAGSSEDKEFFHILEKARYAGRGILVTPDMMLQAFADAVSRLSQEQEKRQAAVLLAFLKASLDWVREHAQSAKRGPWRHLAVGLAVPAVLLETGMAQFEPRFSGYYEPPEEEQETQEELEELARVNFDLTLDALTDEWFREDVRKAIQMLRDGATVELVEGELGAPRKVLIDFSMAIPRGHYDAPGFRQYFQAVTWLGLWPLPVDSSTVAWTWWLATPCTQAAPGVRGATGKAETHGTEGTEGGTPDHTEGNAGHDAEGNAPPDAEGGEAPADENAGEGSPAPADGEPSEAELDWYRACPAEALLATDRFAGALAGPAALPGVVHLVQLLRDRFGRTPMGNPPSPREVTAELKKVLGPLEIRTLEDAVGHGGASEGQEFFVLPKRLSADSKVWKKLTHPDVEMRGLPAALDLMAVLGAAWVESQVQVPEGESWTLDAWRSKVRTLREEWEAGSRGPGSGNLNDQWLELLAGLAALTPTGKLPRFMESSPYRLRLLMSALAGLAQVKHQMVLYSFQNYGVECDAWSPIVVLYEQPVKPRPAAYVEPVPAFYRGLAKLCAEAAAAMGGNVLPLPAPTDECPERLELTCNNIWDDTAPICPGTCMMARYQGRSPLQVLAWVLEVLAAVADKELAGTPLDEWEYRVVRTFGATLEELFLVQEKQDSGMTGADQGRQERGIALVADVYTNVQRKLVLHEAVGKPFLLFAHVPFDGRERIVEGAMLSFYEFTDPNRLDDASWWKLVTSEPARVRSYLPAWAAAFLDD